MSPVDRQPSESSEQGSMDASSSLEEEFWTTLDDTLVDAPVANQAQQQSVLRTREALLAMLDKANGVKGHEAEGGIAAYQLLSEKHYSLPLQYELSAPRGANYPAFVLLMPHIQSPRLASPSTPHSPLVAQITPKVLPSYRYQTDSRARSQRGLTR